MQKLADLKIDQYKLTKSLAEGEQSTQTHLGFYLKYLQNNFHNGHGNTKYYNHILFRLKQLQEAGIKGKKIDKFYEVTCQENFETFERALDQLAWPPPLNRNQHFDLSGTANRAFILFGGAELNYMINKGETLNLETLKDAIDIGYKPIEKTGLYSVHSWLNLKSTNMPYYSPPTKALEAN